MEAIQEQVTPGPPPIQVDACASPGDVNRLLAALSEHQEHWSNQITFVDARKINSFFPNAAVPMTAALELLRSKGKPIEVLLPDTKRLYSTFANSMQATEFNLNSQIDPLSRIWNFSESEVHSLVSQLIKAISERVECNTGVLESMEWCLNEVLDNVSQHSMVDRGFVMVQVHPLAKYLCACVADTGIGIFESFRGTRYKPLTTADAITLAIREHVTRFADTGRGNGLFGLTEIVRNNDGRMRISSGTSSMFFRGKTIARKTVGNEVLDKKHPGTIVDFQVSFNQPIDIAVALGHKPALAEVRLHKLEDGKGEFRVRVRDEAHGVGTRRSGEKFCHYITNLLAEGAKPLVLDFDGISITSSSFADEGVAKVVEKLGLIAFQQAIRLENMSSGVSAIVEVAILKRMSSRPGLQNETR